MSKTMCKTFIDQDMASVRYICKKCSAKARKEKHLCKPKKI